MDGQPMGCSDSAPSEDYTDEQLSRAAEIIDGAQRLARFLSPKEADALKRGVIKSLPVRMRFAITWNRWTYRSG
jgi:hypothetical protein